MGWSFRMDADLGGPEPATVHWGMSYTHNVGDMYREAMGEGGINQLHGKTGTECLELLQPAIEAMEREPAKYRAMNPPNGWGNYEGAFDVLRQLHVWCLETPRALMCIS